MNLTTSYAGGGFFCNCSLRLENLIKFYNAYKQLPIVYDTKGLYTVYKKNTEDITFNYFKHYNDNNINIKNIDYINYIADYQFKNFTTLNFELLNPFIRKYFTPNDNILKIQSEIEHKYSIDYDNICVLFYRGNDKITEIALPPFEDYIIQAKEILKKDPNIKFLIQSDETNFLDTMKSEFPNNIIFYDEIRHMSSQYSTVDKIYKELNYEYSLKYLAITLIMSKCKYIICNSGNCSIWIILFRNNTNNIIQLFNCSIMKNNIYKAYIRS
jgi:hypothetical protein